MKKVNVQTEVAEAMNVSNKTKGTKVSNSENSMKLQPTRKDTKQTFTSYIVSKEQISVSKFFRLLQSYKVESPLQYADFCSAYNLNLNENYSFDWFVANCPKDENGIFAKWTKVSEKVLANKNEAYNRKTEKGIVYTLVPYVSLKADYMQFMQMFLNVVAEVKRIEREKLAAERKAEKEKAKAEREKAQNEKALKAASEVYAEILDLSNKFGMPFETSLEVYATTKKMNVSKELKAVLMKMKNEKKAA